MTKMFFFSVCDFGHNHTFPFIYLFLTTYIYKGTSRLKSSCLFFPREAPSSLAVGHDSGQKLSEIKHSHKPEKTKQSSISPCVHNHQLTAITPQGIFSGRRTRLKTALSLVLLPRGFWRCEGTVILRRPCIGLTVD